MLCTCLGSLGITAIQIILVVALEQEVKFFVFTSLPILARNNAVKFANVNVLLRRFEDSSEVTIYFWENEKKSFSNETKTFKSNVNREAS